MSRSVQPSPALPSVGGQPAQLPALTGLRFVAALAVICDHYWTAFVWWDPATGTPSATAPQPAGWLAIIHGGGLGVDCFFVLSGLILAYTYVRPDGSLRGGRQAFWVARVARIYPIYLVGLALDIIPFLHRSHHPGALLAATSTTPLLLQAWVPQLNSWGAWDPPGWSLSVEAFFYLVFPLLIVWLAAQPRRVLWTAWTLAVGVPAGVSAVAVYVVGAHVPALWWLVDQVLYYNPLVRLPEFLLGATLGILYIRRANSNDSRRSADASQTLPSPRDAALVALLLVLVALQLLPVPMLFPMAVLVAPLFACMIVLLAPGRGVLAFLLSRPWVVWLGEVSYGIYILHAPLWSWLAAAATRLHFSPSAPVLLPVYLVLLLTVAGLAHQLIERPARRTIRAWWASHEGRRAQARAPVAPTGTVRR